MDQSPHKSTGIRRVLNLSIAYEAFQYLIGDHKLYRRIIQMLPSLENKTLLDIGCGSGRFLDFIPESVRYIGYDFNGDYIRKASLKYADRKAEFFVADINEDPDLPKGDIAVAIGVLHHLTDNDCRKFMTSVKNRLNPGGIFLTADPVFVPGQGYLARKIIKADRGQCVRTIDGYLELGKNIFRDTEYKALKNVTNIPYDHLVIKNYN